MSEPFIGEIKIVGFTFPPRGWADCNGQLLPIAQNSALFSLLGTTYGGDGFSTFALPDLRSRLPMHTGSGAGLAPRSQGTMAGNENTTLPATNPAAHNHAGTVVTSPNDGDRSDPAGAYPARVEEPMQAYGMGNKTSFSNMPPFLVVRFIIALTGIFPSRN